MALTPRHKPLSMIPHKENAASQVGRKHHHVGLECLWSGSRLLFVGVQAGYMPGLMDSREQGTKTRVSTFSYFAMDSLVLGKKGRKECVDVPAHKFLSFVWASFFLFFCQTKPKTEKKGGGSGRRATLQKEKKAHKRKGERVRVETPSPMQPLSKLVLEKNRIMPRAAEELPRHNKGTK